MKPTVLDYLPSILEGTVLTAGVAILSLLVATTLGLLSAMAKLNGGVMARSVVGTYTTLIRGCPELVLIMLVYYGGQIGINQLTKAFGWGYMEIPAFTAGFITLGFIYGAYMSETFRGAYLAIPRGQIEAAIATGMSKLTIFKRIIMPQLMSYALPAYSNNWQVLLKATALVSIIGLEDLVRRADIAGKSVREPFTYFAVVLVIYLLFTAVSEYIFKRLKRKYRLPS